MPNAVQPPSRFHWSVWKILLAGGAAVLVVLLGGFGFLVMREARKLSAEAAQSLSTNDLTRATASSSLVPRADRTLVESGDDPSIGLADAKVTIVEFGDFECPFCLRSFSVLKDLFAKYRNEVRFIYRDFPNSDLHPHALSAALAAGCAQDQGKFWQYHDLLFLNQERLEDNDLLGYAEQLRLNMDAFSACFTNRAHEDEITQDVETGVTAGVNGTPTWFVNGVRIEGALPFDVFSKVIDYGIQGRL